MTPCPNERRGEGGKKEGGGRGQGRSQPSSAWKERKGPEVLEATDEQVLRKRKSSHTPGGKKKKKKKARRRPQKGKKKILKGETKRPISLGGGGKRGLAPPGMGPKRRNRQQTVKNGKKGQRDRLEKNPRHRPHKEGGSLRLAQKKRLSPAEKKEGGLVFLEEKKRSKQHQTTEEEGKRNYLEKRNQGEGTGHDELFRGEKEEKKSQKIPPRPGTGGGLNAVSQMGPCGCGQNRKEEYN